MPQRAVDGAARQVAVHTAMHDLDDIVQRQAQAGAQFAHQSFLDLAQACGEPVGPVRAIDDGVARAPPPNGRLMDAEFLRQFGDGRRAGLDIGPHFRRRGRVRVQLYIHRSRHSLA